MQVTRDNNGIYTIKATEKEINNICEKLAFEEGYQDGQGDFKCARLLEHIRRTLRNFEWDKD